MVQIFMQSTAVLEISLVIFFGINRQLEKDGAVFLKQTYWADILCNLKYSRLPVLEILVLSKTGLVKTIKVNSAIDFFYFYNFK